ncbi:unnamed protein product [Paramecium sonneborni]|uniref:Uncharacterized protein n=1 Tax=Paramecium sonneborni TaxID=65129 RepID=A0A8S1K2H7_9CILI|nr:unnamed protein product [Paramecium sonneborni]
MVDAKFYEQPMIFIHQRDQLNKSKMGKQILSNSRKGSLNLFFNCFNNQRIKNYSFPISTSLQNKIQTRNKIKITKKNEDQKKLKIRINENKLKKNVKQNRSLRIGILKLNDIS